MRLLLKISALGLAILLGAPPFSAQKASAAEDPTDQSKNEDPSGGLKKKKRSKKKKSDANSTASDSERKSTSKMRRKKSDNGDSATDTERKVSSKTRGTKSGGKSGGKNGSRSSRTKTSESATVPATASDVSTQTKPAETTAAPTQTTAPPQPPAPGLQKALNPPPPSLSAVPPPTIQKSEKPAKPAPTMTFEPVDVSGKSAERQKLDVALREFKDEHYDLAAVSSYELMQDPKLAELHMDANFLLAKSLYRMGMYHSSLGELSQILAKGPQSRFFKSSLEWLFFISHKTTNESVILGEIAKYSNAEFPEKFRSEFRYLLARYHFVRGRALDLVEQKAEASKSFDEVKRLALSIPKGDAFYARAKYLEGLAYFREDNFNSSLESMKEVIRVTRPGGAKAEAQARADKDARELAFMQLARTHYGHRQNRYAIYYYNKVERGGKQWLEALFESSWASYRIGQYEQALGNLITLSSPFFQEEYFPEALILKAVIYYENCRYRESSWILEDFERIYLPVHDQLDVLLKKEMDASAYYSILELEAELDALSQRPDSFRYSNLAKTLVDDLKKQREVLIKKAGIMAKGKLEFELAELKKLLTNGLRIKFETTTKEKEFLEEQLRAGGAAEIVKKYKYSVAVADDQLYWPYEGEYWRDELGTYQYTLTKGCIERNANRVAEQAKRTGD